MTDKFISAFNAIRAEENLKADTALFLQKKLLKEEKSRSKTMIVRYAAAAAVLAVILLTGVFAHGFYYTPDAYVDIDVNPSVGLTLNKLDRVIGVHAYNSDGARLLSEYSPVHYRRKDALELLLDALDSAGYISDDGLVSVTLQTSDAGREAKLLESLLNDVSGIIEHHHKSAQLDVFSVGGDIRAEAYEAGLTPAMYIAIQELIEVDPFATVDSCRGHTISEIKQLTREHAGNHHGNGSAGDSSESDSAASNSDSAESHSAKNDSTESHSPETDTSENHSPETNTSENHSPETGGQHNGKSQTENKGGNSHGKNHGYGHQGR